ncbi:3'(2'),5'-bisphosphate nucleotidase [bacterium CG17_big_fil_post_rev_8_21_14_2_50_64_8]|nr:MAG: 3'(2'),5'-bisphosphate nucleotidase [bacterium CG17_big_fil_post_rev_8_21_14_2_50_64_8]PJA75804.1 MAG: 3'(2'),5'-bisphosphate nucleotidase [bacterium CG_4_9_14_3_um_filter_65_15]
MPAPWNDHPLASEIEIAASAVRKAGALCRAVQGGIDRGALEKKDRSPVTVADFGSQAVVCRLLGEKFPDDPVIGEEDSQALRDPDNAVLMERVVGHVRDVIPDADADRICAWIDRGGAKTYSPRFWTLDPIDGTKGFLRGQQYAVALALILDGRVEVALLGCPNLGPKLDGDRADGTLAVAVRGHGAWQMPLLGEGDAEPLRVSPQADNTQIRFCESVEAAHSSHGDAARIADRLAIAAEPARLDSQAKYAVVARGEAEAYLRLPRDGKYREKIWDHAGGVLVVTEAGGRVTDIRGNDLDFSLGFRLENNTGVIVTNGKVHEPVLKAISDLEIGIFPAASN